MKRKGGKTRSGLFSYTARGRQAWGADYRDPVTGRRRRKAGFETKAVAVEWLAKADRQELGLEPLQEPPQTPQQTVSAYAEKWLGIASSSLKPATIASYEGTLRLHVLPTFGAVSIGSIDRTQVRDLLAAKLHEGLSRNSVRIIHACLRVMLATAQDDGIITENPAHGLGRKLKLTTRRRGTNEKALAFDPDSLARFLAVAEVEYPRYYPVFYLMASTGVRPGEARGLKWTDVDLQDRKILIERTLTKGQVGTTKSGKSRKVDVSETLADFLRRHETQAKAEGLRRGQASEWVFTTKAGTAFDEGNVGRAFEKTIRKAGLPEHYHPHCLRHTFAFIHLKIIHSPIAWVKDQMGHASIQVTYDVYGDWFPAEDAGAADRYEARISESIKKVAAGA